MCDVPSKAGACLFRGSGPFIGRGGQASREDEGESWTFPLQVDRSVPVLATVTGEHVSSQAYNLWVQHITFNARNFNASVNPFCCRKLTSQLHPELLKPCFLNLSLRPV